MNILVQTCGLIIILVLMLFYVKKERLNLHTQLMFRNMLVSLFFCLSFDILSIMAIYNRDTLPMFLVVAVCKIYLATLVAVALAGFLYVYVDILEKQSRIMKGIRFYSALAILDVVIMFLTPIYVCQDGSIAYTDGPCIFVTYAGAAGFVFYNLFFITRHRNALNPRRRKSMLMWLGVWILATVIQFFNRELLIIGFAGAIGTMIVFLRMENPELSIDRDTGLFNAGAMTDYLDELYQQEHDFAVMTILFRYGFQKNRNAKVEMKVMFSLAQQLIALPHSRSFRMSDNIVQIIYRHPEHAAADVPKVRDILDALPKIHKGKIYAELVYLPSSDIIRSDTELSSLVQYIDSKGLAHVYEHFLEVTPELIDRMRHEFQIITLINEAIEHDRIEVFYQPIFSTMSQSFTSAEALARMRDRDGNLVSPGDFIPIAESTGLILQIGEIVFNKVCRFFMERNLSAFGLRYIEVNLSVVQCADPELANTYIDIMEQHQISPKYINLEITESASMEAKQTLLNNMNRLIDYGVSFSLDDFGTGQSNLNYIMEMPVDIVKFDKDMTNAYFQNEKAKYIMDAAIQMVHGMKLGIVSEGIETKNDYETLAEKGIDYIQGYYFSKPLPETEFMEFLARQHK